jgi:hypothetical protein
VLATEEAARCLSCDTNLRDVLAVIVADEPPPGGSRNQAKRALPAAIAVVALAALVTIVVSGRKATPTASSNVSILPEAVAFATLSRGFGVASGSGCSSGRLVARRLTVVKTSDGGRTWHAARDGIFCCPEFQRQGVVPA